MTNQRKIEILKQARELITLRNLLRRYGMCWAIYETITGNEYLEHDPYNNLEFYGIEQPAICYTNQYYYPLTEQGVTDRHRAIDKAIEKLEKEIK